MRHKWDVALVIKCVIEGLLVTNFNKLQVEGLSAHKRLWYDYDTCTETEEERS
jgi:hypothetical protein